MRGGKARNFTYKSTGESLILTSSSITRGVIYITLSGLQVHIAKYSYVRLLTRLPFGLTDSAAAPSAKSCPYMLLPLLFLLNGWLELSSTDANVSSNSNSIEGQLSFKCTNASDCITAEQGITMHQSFLQSLKFYGFQKAQTACYKTNQYTNYEVWSLESWHTINSFCL